MESQTSIPKFPPPWPKLLLLYFLFSIIFLLQILFWLPFLFFRWFVIVLVKFKSDQYSNILDTWETMMADDDFTNNKSNFTILAILELNGILTLERLTKCIHKALTLKDNQFKGKIRYWKLRQYPVNILGYWFWKNEEHFSIDDHLKQIDYTYLNGHSNYNTKSVANLHSKLLHNTFPKNRSPWDITLITNVPSSNQDISLVALRLHHCLGDGKSVIKFIVEGLGGTVSRSALPSKKLESGINRMFSTKLLNFITNALNLYPNIVDISVKAYLTKTLTKHHPWRVKNFKEEKSPFVLQFTKEISISKLKSEILEKINEKVSPSAVLLTAISESIRKFLENTKYKNDPIFLLSTLPKRDHPNTFTNHFEWGTLILRNDSSGNYVNLLSNTHHTYVSLRDDSTAHNSMQIYQYAVSTFIKPIRKILPQNGLFVSAVSNFAGNDDEFCIENLPCTDFSLSTGQPRTSIGVMFTIFSYKKSIRFCVMSRESILTEDECEHMSYLIEEQINCMSEISK